MKLRKVLSYIKNFEVDENFLESEVDSIVINPEKAQKGSLFVSLKKGEEGRKNIYLALKNGASAFLSEERYDSKKQIFADFPPGYACTCPPLTMRKFAQCFPHTVLDMRS